MNAHIVKLPSYGTPHPVGEGRAVLPAADLPLLWKLWILRASHGKAPFGIAGDKKRNLSVGVEKGRLLDKVAHPRIHPDDASKSSFA